MPQLVTSYVVGDTLIIALVCINKNDKGNVILEDAGGRQHRFSDATILASAIDITTVGSVPADPIAAPTAPAAGAADPGDSGVTLRLPT